MDVPTYYLEIWAQDRKGVRPLVSSPVTIGSSNDNSIVLGGDRMVSRHHAVIERIGSTWVVRDLDSTNGTFVNGKRIWSEHPLQPGDEIHLGRRRLVLRAEGRVRADDSTDTGESRLLSHRGSGTSFWLSVGP